MRKKFFNKGIGLLEVVIAVAVISLSMMGILLAYRTHLNAEFKNVETIQAAYLLEEGIEAVKVLRDFSWTTNISTLTASTTYHLVFEQNRWKATSTVQVIENKYYRTFALYNVQRDSNDDISSSGTVDNNAKRVKVFVSWQQDGATTTREMSTYITNLQGN